MGISGRKEIAATSDWFDRYPEWIQLKRASTPGQIAEALEGFGFTQEEIAQCVGEMQQRIDTNLPIIKLADQAVDRLVRLKDLVLLFETRLKPAGVPFWFRAKSPYIHDLTPLEGFRDGDFASVSDAAHSFVEGAYS